MEGKATPLARKPPPASDARRRGVPEDDILAMLMHGGCAHLLAAGRRQEARDVASDALGRWVAAGLPYEVDAGGRRRFDPSEVINGFKWAGLHGRDHFWRERWIATGRRLSEEAWSRNLRGGPIRVGFLRRFDLGAFPEDAEILLRAPTPLAGQDHAVTALEICAPDQAARIDLSDGRITARLRRGALSSATLGWSASLTPAAPPQAPESLSAEAAELYLKPADGLIQAGARVRELATNWAAGRGGWDAVLAFRRSLGASFCLGYVGYEAFAPRTALEWVLDHGWYDCLLGSSLLVSLCRAHGLPARLVGGHLLYPLDASNHTWAEVWIEGRGWVAVDLLGWELSAGDADSDWRDTYFGQTDRRLVTERPPRRITGPMSVRLPGVWRVVQVSAQNGAEIRFVEAASGRTAFSDRLSVAPG